MRFTASMVGAPNFDCTECDMKRHFVLSFYVEDNSLSISEPPNKDTLTGAISSVYVSDPGQFLLQCC